MDDFLAIVGFVSLLVIGIGGLISLYSILKDLLQKKRPRLWSFLSLVIAAIFILLIGSWWNTVATQNNMLLRNGSAIVGAILIFVFLLLDQGQKEKRDLADELARQESAFKITAEYSYARDRLKSHLINKNPEDILDDVIRVIDEYAYSNVSKTIGPFNFVEMTQYLAEALSSGITSVKKAQNETKMMRPVLAGLKKLVLIHDCGVKESDIPNDVSKIIELNGPKEVDDVIRYLAEQGFN